MPWHWVPVHLALANPTFNSNRVVMRGKTRGPPHWYGAFVVVVVSHDWLDVMYLRFKRSLGKEKCKGVPFLVEVVRWMCPLVSVSMALVSLPVAASTSTNPSSLIHLFLALQMWVHSPTGGCVHIHKFSHINLLFALQIRVHSSTSSCICIHKSPRIRWLFLFADASAFTHLLLYPYLIFGFEEKLFLGFDIVLQYGMVERERERETNTVDVNEGRFILIIIMSSYVNPKWV